MSHMEDVTCSFESSVDINSCGLNYIFFILANELYYRLPSNRQETEEQICGQILARCKSNRVVVVDGFNFPNIDWDSLSAWVSDRAEFVRSIQEGFLK
eukprot:g43974.t1